MRFYPEHKRGDIMSYSSTLITHTQKISYPQEVYDLNGDFRGYTIPPVHRVDNHPFLSEDDITAYIAKHYSRAMFVNCPSGSDIYHMSASPDGELTIVPILTDPKTDKVSSTVLMLAEHLKQVYDLDEQLSNSMTVTFSTVMDLFQLPSNVSIIAMYDHNATWVVPPANSTDEVVISNQTDSFLTSHNMPVNERNVGLIIGALLNSINGNIIYDPATNLWVTTGISSEIVLDENNIDKETIAGLYDPETMSLDEITVLEYVANTTGVLYESLKSTDLVETYLDVERDKYECDYLRQMMINYARGIDITDMIRVYTKYGNRNIH